MRRCTRNCRHALHFVGGAACRRRRRRLCCCILCLRLLVLFAVCFAVVLSLAQHGVKDRVELAHPTLDRRRLL
jgi:hypothetical protein